MNSPKLWLFSAPKTPLPHWFYSYGWNGIGDIVHKQNSFLDSEEGFMEYKVNDAFSINIPSLERAILECLYLAPKDVSTTECFEILEGLTTLRPALLQALLESCQSVKVVRLFLYMAEKANHSWFRHLEPEKMNLGSGNRLIDAEGKYQSKYQITVIPQE